MPMPQGDSVSQSVSSIYPVNCIFIEIREIRSIPGITRYLSDLGGRGYCGNPDALGGLRHLDDLRYLVISVISKVLEILMISGISDILVISVK